MIKRNYILFILLILLCCSCLDNKKHNNQPSVPKVEYISDGEFLETYFSTIDIPYLLQEEKDSILNNKLRIIADKKYRSEFISNARGRRSAIRKFNYNTYNGKKVPAPFKRFLLPNELSKFDKDSISHFVILYELYKKRLDTIRSITNYPLTHDEIQKLIRGSYKDSIYYKELSANRFKKDSIKSSTRFNKRKDSLQSIIHPIDSVLPFGPKALGELIKNNTHYLGFNTIKGDFLKEDKKQNRKDIYNTWLYFLKLHPNSEIYENEGYYGKMLPPIKTYQHIDLNYEHKFNPIGASFTLRLSNIGKYEVYYTTTGEDYPTECNAQTKKEENCCFGEDYFCETTGYLVFYDRKKEHSIVLEVFALDGAGQGYTLNLRFFYAEDNIVHVFDGKTRFKKGYYKDPFINSNAYYKNESVEVSYSHKIDVKANGDFVLTEQCVPIDFIAKGYSTQGIVKREERLKSNLIDTKRIRDSIFNKIEPVIPNYPFGPELLKTHKFPKKKFIEYTNKDSLNVHAKVIDSILPFYKKTAIAYQLNINKLPSKEEARFLRAYTLPNSSIIKKIELSPIDIWRQHYFKNLTNNNDCSNIRGIAIKDIVDFRLPNINNHEVYFSTDTYLNGTLTLYNPVTKQANVINAIDINDSYFRVFYINEDAQIEIYQGLRNENSDYKSSTYKINKTHTIEVLSNNEIKVTPQN